MQAPRKTSPRKAATSARCHTVTCCVTAGQLPDGQRCGLVRRLSLSQLPRWQCGHMFYERCGTNATTRRVRAPCLVMVKRQVWIAAPLATWSTEHLFDKVNCALSCHVGNRTDVLHPSGLAGGRVSEGPLGYPFTTQIVVLSGACAVTATITPHAPAIREGGDAQCRDQSHNHPTCYPRDRMTTGLRSVSHPVPLSALSVCSEAYTS